MSPPAPLPSRTPGLSVQPAPRWPGRQCGLWSPLGWLCVACNPSWYFLTHTSCHLEAGILSEWTAASTLTGHCRRTRGGTAVRSPTWSALSTETWSWSCRVSPRVGLGTGWDEGRLMGELDLEHLCLEKLHKWYIFTVGKLELAQVGKKTLP